MGRGIRIAALLLLVLVLVAAPLLAQAPAPTPPPTATPSPTPSVLAQIDKAVREGFYDPALKGVDWDKAVRRAADELAGAGNDAEKNAAYDRLLAILNDSHTFRLPPGRLPDRNWGTAGVRVGQDGEGYAVKGVLPGSAAEAAGMKVGDRVLAANGIVYGPSRVSFRDLFFVFEGLPGESIEITWQHPGETVRKDRLVLRLEDPGDALVWKSARVLRRQDESFGYVRLWGMSAETALALVDLLLDREAIAKSRPELGGWGQIEGLLLDVRGNSGGYDPNILPTFLRGQWNAGDFYALSRGGRRLVPPTYKPLPVVLLVNSGTASAGEALALKFRAHRIGSIVGETTSGMASGGAVPTTLPDGSTLWMSIQAIESLDGQSFEGHGVAPDVAVPDRPAAGGGEDGIVEAGLKLLQAQAGNAVRR